MRAPADTQALDFNLQKLVFLPAIAAKVQSGAVRQVVIPCNPQPVIDAEALRLAGLPHPESMALMRAVQRAFRQGLIGASTAPIRVGRAFELLQALPPEKYSRLGTGLVTSIEITRYSHLGDRELQACGHFNKDTFAEYWDITTPDMPTSTNPWCWLIQFEYKG